MDFLSVFPLPCAIPPRHKRSRAVGGRPKSLGRRKPLFSIPERRGPETLIVESSSTLAPRRRGSAGPVSTVLSRSGHARPIRIRVRSVYQGLPPGRAISVARGPNRMLCRTASRSWVIPGLLDAPLASLRQLRSRIIGDFADAPRLRGASQLWSRTLASSRRPVADLDVVPVSLMLPAAIMFPCPRHFLRDPIPLDPLLPRIEPALAVAAFLVRPMDH